MACYDNFGMPLAGQAYHRIVPSRNKYTNLKETRVNILLRLQAGVVFVQNISIKNHLVLWGLAVPESRDHFIQVINSQGNPP